MLDFELHRGAGKTTIAAGEALTELVLGGHHRRIYAFAVDEDQSRILLDVAAGFVRRSPALSKLLKVDRKTIRFAKRDALLQIMSADAASAYGLTPDLIVFDEIGELRNRALFDAAFTSIAKKPQARLIAISTPGWTRSSVAWELRQACAKIDGYYLYSPGERIAGWLDAAELERQRQLLPDHVFRRQHLGQWTEGEGRFITTEDLARCLRPDLTAQLACAEGSHVLAVDLGLSNDRTAAAIVHRTDLGARLELIRTWQGTRASPVGITTEVEPFMFDVLQHFSDLRMILDPWQARSTFERFASFARVQPFIFTGGKIDELTRNLYALLHAGQIELYPDEELEHELLDVQVIEKSYGLRIDHRVGAHDDRVIALGMAAWAAMQLHPVYDVGPDYDGYLEDTRISPF